MNSKDTTNRDVFGCDIGNGFGFISVLKEIKSDPVPMIPAKYRLGTAGMPTSAYITPPGGNAIEVFDGQPACDKHKGEPDKFIHAVKTGLGEGAVSVPGINRPVAIDAVYAAVARDLIKLGNEERKNRGENPVYEIVFTYPASFASDLTLLNRMQKSIEGIKVDGHSIKVVGRLPEPAAVAIDYLYYMQNIAPPDIRIGGDSYTALVYDLGHGTFDVAVVTARSKGEPFQIHINEGLPDVGGRDFDDILYKEICRRLGIDHNNARENIRRTAVEMKHELSDEELSRHEISMPDGGVAEIKITREWFEKRSMMLINQTFVLVSQVVQQAKSKGIHIDTVVLSGGASQMPMVESKLKQLLGKEDIGVQSYRPSEAVSYGAARYAYGRSYVTPQPIPVPDPTPKATTKPIPKATTGSTQEPTPTPTSLISENFSEYDRNIIYIDAVERMDRAKSVLEFREVAGIFSTLSGFKDSDAKKAGCMERADECAKQETYDSAIDMISKAKGINLLNWRKY